MYISIVIHHMYVSYAHYIYYSFYCSLMALGVFICFLVRPSLAV